MLVDGGGVRDRTFDIGEKVVSPFLWRKGIKKIDNLVLTHPEADHMNGLIAIVRNFKPQEFWQSDIFPESGSFVDFKETFPPGLAVRKLHAGESLFFGKINLEVLHPPISEESFVSSLNNSSLVIRLVYGKTSFLLTGDIEVLAEKEILDNINLEKTQVLKSPHHGSSSSSSMEFLAAVSPEIVVVSAGRNNPYNLPSPRVLHRYRQIGAKIYRTDIHGAVEISSDGEKISVRTSLDVEQN